MRTTASGTNCETVTSQPFGDAEVISGGCGDPSPMHFTGQQRDAETATQSGGTDGLDDFGARYLSSALGRFASPDSTAFSSLRTPQAWNVYGYALNNPIRYNDPSGHIVQCTGNSQQCQAAIAAATANAEAASRVTTTTTTTQHSFLGLFHFTTTTTTITIKGDIKSFAALSSNAGKLAQLVSDTRVVRFEATPVATPTPVGRFEAAFEGGHALYGGGASYTPSMGYEPSAFVDPASSKDVDQDAQRDNIPSANLGEKTAHELLGHVWGELFGGHLAGTAQNKQDAINAENEVRATDPTRGQKTKHHD